MNKNFERLIRVGMFAKIFNISYRRGFSFICLIIIQLFLFHTASSFAQLANTPWPMFMHDFQHTGQSTFSGPQNSKLHQRYLIGAEVAASPVLGSDGAVYVGDADGNFYAITTEGKKRLLLTTNGGIYNAAAVGANDVVYVGSEDGYLYAVQTDGVLEWSFRTSGSINSSPVINLSDGTIYFCSEDKGLYAVSSGGSKKWRYELDEESWSSPALDISNNTVYVGSINGVLYAVDAGNGSKKWNFDTGDFIIGSPAIDAENGLVFIGTAGGKIYAVDRNSGSLKWTYPQGEGVYIGSVSSTPAIDTATGSDAICVGSEDGKLYSLDRTNGSLNWAYNAGNAIDSSPAIDEGGFIYFGSENGNIHSVSEDGTLNWTYATGGEVYSSPAIGANGLLYIGSYDGYVYAIGSEVSTKLTADFTATPMSGSYPLTVQFIDRSVGEVTSWKWDFGDGATASTQNPSYTYNSAGEYTVSLKVTGKGISDTEEKEGFISVKLKQSEITPLEISPSEIIFGESLTIQGTITVENQAQIPLSSPAEVVFNFTESVKGTATTVVASNINGSFTLADYFPPAGGTWTVTASWAGNDIYGGAESDKETFTVNQAEVTGITFEPSSGNIQTDQTLSVSGVVTLNPDNEVTRKNFVGNTLKLVRFNPYEKYEKIIEVQPSLSGGQITYKFEDISLPYAGVWELSVGYDTNASFKGMASPEDENEREIEVDGIQKELVGYAILVEGFVEDKSGMDSHNLTTNYIYKTLLQRGFKSENIYYLNYDTSQSGVTAKTSEENVLDAIKSWASEKMNNAPAPLYVIFVGHGGDKEFFIYPDTLTAKEIADAIDNLEDKKLTTSALENPIVIVFGANRSGSFIDKISKQGSKRIIITSSDAEEIAYKGPLPQDETLRHGDYFVYELFNYASRNIDLKRCFEEAAKEMSVFTSSGTTTVGSHFDSSAQHPIFDDNGDGVGTYYSGSLFSLSGTDGVLSTGHIIGNTTSAANLELTEVTGLISLEANESSPVLYASVNNTALAEKTWLEIAVPGSSLVNNNNVTEQQVVNMPRFNSDYFDQTEQEFIWNDFSDNTDFNNFGDAGRYKVFYFSRDNTSKIAPFRESEVIKNEADNQPPSDFGFVYPPDGVNTPVVLNFDWQDVETSEGETVTYTFQISTSADFVNDLVYEQTGLLVSNAVVDSSAGLKDGVTYYWRAIAVDSKGGVTYIGSSGKLAAGKFNRLKSRNNSADSESDYNSFKPKLSNGYPGYVKGFVFDETTEENIGDATITIKDIEGSYNTTKDGAYFIELPSGTYKISAKASGYASKTETVNVEAMETVVQNIGLTESSQSASISGKVTDKKTEEPLAGVLITIENDAITETTTSDIGGDYSITSMEHGEYNLKAEKTGYKIYEKEIKLKAGKDKEKNIKMKEEK